MSVKPELEDRLISDIPGLTGSHVNPLAGNNIRTVGDFERLTKTELTCLWGVGAITIKKVRAAIDIERCKIEGAAPSPIGHLTERTALARDEGFYWVRWQSEPQSPQIAEWSSRGRFEIGWYLTGWDYPEPDERIEVISDRLVPPSI